MINQLEATDLEILRYCALNALHGNGITVDTSEVAAQAEKDTRGMAHPIAEANTFSSLKMLNENGRIKIFGVARIGSPTVLTMSGFRAFAMRDIDEYSTLELAVAQWVLDNVHNAADIAQKVNKPLPLIRWVLGGFIAQGYCRGLGEGGGTAHVHSVTETFTRQFGVERRGDVKDVSPAMYGNYE